MKIDPTDILGHVFGRLTVLTFVGRSGPRGRYLHYRCRCTCGSERDYNRSNLLSNRTNSCGCLRKEQHSRSMGLAHKRWSY